MATAPTVTPTKSVSTAYSSCGRSSRRRRAAAGHKLDLVQQKQLGGDVDDLPVLPEASLDSETQSGDRPDPAAAGSDGGDDAAPDDPPEDGGSKGPPKRFTAAWFRAVDADGYGLPGARDDTLLVRVMQAAGYFVILASVCKMIVAPFISRDEQSGGERDLWFALECVVTVLFTAEALIRAALYRDTIVQYLKTFTMICLICATLPLYVELLLGTFMEETATIYRAVNLLRLARLMRLSRLVHGRNLLEAILVSLVVIWGIYTKHDLDEPA